MLLLQAPGNVIVVCYQVPSPMPDPQLCTSLLRIYRQLSPRDCLGCRPSSQRTTGPRGFPMLSQPPSSSRLWACTSGSLSLSRSSVALHHLRTAHAGALFVRYSCIRKRPLEVELVDESTESDIARLEGGSSLSPYLQVCQLEDACSLVEDCLG